MLSLSLIRYDIYFFIFFFLPNKKVDHLLILQTLNKCLLGSVSFLKLRLRKLEISLNHLLILLIFVMILQLYLNSRTPKLPFFVLGSKKLFIYNTYIFFCSLGNLKSITHNNNFLLILFGDYDNFWCQCGTFTWLYISQLWVPRLFNLLLWLWLYFLSILYEHCCSITTYICDIIEC